MSPTALKTECPHCEGHIEYGTDVAGTTISCPHCAEVFSLPVAEPPPLVPSSMQSRPPNANLTVCRDCRREVSRAAYSCPHCGASLKRRHGVFYYVFVGTLSLIGTLTILFLALVFFGFISTAFLVGLANREGAEARTSAPALDPAARKPAPLTDEEVQLAQAFQTKLRHEFDDIEGITWHRPPDVSTRTDNAWGNTCRLYIGKRKTGAPWLRLYIRYYGDNWVFVDEFKFKIGDELLTLDPRTRLKHENSAGSVWEVYDTSASDHRSLINKLVKADAITIRYQGRDRSHDYALHREEVEHLKLMLLVYRHMGGEW